MAHLCKCMLCRPLPADEKLRLLTGHSEPTILCNHLEDWRSQYELCICLTQPICAHRERKAKQVSKSKVLTKPGGDIVNDFWGFETQCFCPTCYECSQSGCVVDSTGECSRCPYSQAMKNTYYACAHNPRQVDKRKNIVPLFEKTKKPRLENNV